MLLGLKAPNEVTVTVLVYFSGPEFYFSHLLIVVFPGELPTFQFD